MHMLLGGVSTAALILAATPALAQPTDKPVSAETEATPAGQIEAADTPVGDIIVTAQRRAENLQNVPIAIQAFSGSTLAVSRVVTVLDLPKLTPSFRVFSLGLGAPRAFVRGVGTNDLSIGTDQSVATFVDDVFTGRTGAAVSNLADVNRIELLKGPQGALFGRSAIAGAIAIYTKPPVDRFEGEVEGGLGSDAQHKIRAMANVPLAPGLAARFNAGYNHRGGYVENLVNGEKFGVQNNYSARGAVRYAHDALIIDVRADYGRSHSQAQPQRSVGIPASVIALYGLQPENAPYQKTYSDLRADETMERRKTWGVMARIDREFDVGTLSSISAYRGYKLFYGGDGEWTSRRILFLAQGSDADTFSQELRFASSKLGSLDFIAGVSYFKEDANQQTIRGVGYPVISILRGNTPFPQSLYVDERVFSHNDYTSYSIFGNVGLDITEALRLQGSLRYSHDRKKFDIFSPGIPQLGNTALFFNVNNPRITRTASWSDFSPRATLSWQATSDVMVYGTFARGYKPGGFNTTTTAGDSINPFAEETVTSYELGFKSAFFDRRVRLNLAVFDYNFDGLQLTTFENGVIVVRNGTTAGRGIETDLAWTITPSLRVQATGSYSDVKYKSYSARRAGVFVSFAGNRAIYTPEFAGSFIADYDHSLSNGGKVFAHFEEVYTGKQYFDPDNAPANTEPSYWMTNVRIGYSTPNERWTVSAVAENLFQTEYRLRTNQGTESFGFPVTLDGPPPYYGVELKMKF